MSRPARLAGILSLASVLFAVDGSASGQTGDGAGALPAVGRLDVASRLQPGVAVASSAGYGYTESVLGDSDRHHRLGGTLAASVVPVPWLAVGGRLEGRYDWHSSAAAGTDDGWIGDPRLVLRAGGELGRLALAGQATVWVPGRTAPSVAFGATSFDLVALASLRPAGAPIVLASTLGLRLDRSARSAEDAERMSDADRLSLGVGEGPSLLTGLGATARVGRSVDLLGELTWDLALDGYPRALASPLRIGAGARWSATAAFALQALVVAVATERPALEPDGPLTPIEPRVSVTLTAILRSGAPASAAAGRRAATVGSARPARRDAGTTQAAAPGTGTVRGSAVGAEGGALPGARVQVTIGTAAPVEAVADDQGHFEATGLTEGEGTLRVSAEGHEDTERPVRIVAGTAAEVDVTLPRSLPRGQLRGTVTSVQGQPLEARVVVQPLGQEVRCEPDGTFQIDVAPGSYTVEIEAPGFRSQERRVVIEDNGVTILNVDLRARR